MYAQNCLIFYFERFEDITFIEKPIIIKILRGSHFNDIVIICKMTKMNLNKILYEFNFPDMRRAGSDGSMSVLVQQVRRSIPGEIVNFHLKIFNLGARKCRDVHSLIARLYITVLD